MLDSLLYQLDQFDTPIGEKRDEAEKLAQKLNERREALKTASADDFAVVLYDGHDHHRKLPVQTKTDIRMSKTALNRREDQLPDEVIETAKYYIDRASREKLAESAYESRPEKVATNVVFVGEIDKEAWEKKRASKEPEDMPMIQMGEMKYPLKTEAHVKQAAKLFVNGTGNETPKKQANVGRRLIKRAKELDVDIDHEKIARYDRDDLPVTFEDHLEYRKRRASDELSPYYDGLAKKADNMPIVESAHKLHQLDKAAGFTPMKGEKIASSRQISPDAWEVVFPKGGARKEAKNEQNIEKIAETFGKNFAEKYKNDPEKARKRLTNAEKQMLRQIQ